MGLDKTLILVREGGLSYKVHRSHLIKVNEAVLQNKGETNEENVGSRTENDGNEDLQYFSDDDKDSSDFSGIMLIKMVQAPHHLIMNTTVKLPVVLRSLRRLTGEVGWHRVKAHN